MPLTDTAVRNAKPGVAARKMGDAGGLYLLVTVSGSKLWRYDYRFGGKRKTLALGAYPDVSLADARDRHSVARRMLAEAPPRDPGAIRQADRAQQAATNAEQERRTIARELLARGEPVPGSFEFIAREWIAKIHRVKVSAGHADRTLVRFEKDAFPWIGARPLGEITAPELLEVVRRVEARGAIETAHRLKDAAGQVFRYGIASGLCDRNPAADLRDALQPVKVKHHAAIIEPVALGKLLRDIDGYTGQPATLAALKLSAILLLRPGELRHLEWAWLDEEGACITVPGAAMKRRKEDKLDGPPHLVPLATQALALLRELRPYTGAGQYIFPSLTSHRRPISENTVRSALRRLGYANDEMTAHGFRATARTLAAERLGIEPEVIEAQLAHAVPDALGRAYNRTQFLEQRKAMMQRWADYIDQLKAGAQVIPMPGSAAA
ncbi:prophage CP4-57 integrase [mine drainage metagenome]|uniref:Prophage CP4-57 integrase n=1 Tax=mine drainage metagenome TaxID=410659 RepID=A0A1J5QU22_9ZZZZ